MFLNLKDLRRIRDAAALWGHPPRAYRQSPPRLSAVCGFTRKVRCFACLWPKFPKLKGLAGASPHTPSLTCDAAGAGGRRKRRAPYHLPLRQSVFFGRGGKGYPKRFIKTIKPSLQIFLDVLPLPWYKLQKPGGASPLNFTGYRADTEKGGNRPSKGKKHVP